MAVVDPLSKWASKLWYSSEEIDLFKESFSKDVHMFHLQIGDQKAASGKELTTIDAATILGLEKYLSPEIATEYKNRRIALRRVVLEEHRWHRALQIPHSARLTTLSAQKSRWAREKARAAALFLEQDVLQDFQEMNLCTKTAPRRRSMSDLKEANITEKENEGHTFQRRGSTGYVVQL